LPGKKVAYFSSAGNQGSAGGRGSIDVPNATFSILPTGLGNINLATAATCASFPSSGSTKADFSGGWLDFGGGTYAMPVTYTSAGSTLAMQWDDLFYHAAVTTDLNWYMFNSAGSCVFTFASNNFSNDNGFEFVNLNGGASGSYRIMVARTGPGTHQATRVRMVNFAGWGGAAFTPSSRPTTFGHSAAANASSVAAYRYTSPASQQSPFIPAFELFSSPGPVVIAFDAANNRLPVPETRKKPDMAAPDGGDTTFFFPGTDFEPNGRFNFFGTSAAAPHAAGVAALLLQKGGGPNSLTPKQIKSVLQTTAPARVIPFVGGPATKTWSLYDGFGLIDAVNALNKLP
jgi:subtilisin family serine protease